MFRQRFRSKNHNNWCRRQRVFRNTLRVSDIRSRLATCTSYNQGVGKVGRRQLTLVLVGPNANSEAMRKVFGFSYASPDFRYLEIRNMATNVEGALGGIFINTK